MESRNLLGKGMTAEIYEWDHGKVLKLFFEGFTEAYIEYERQIANILNDIDIQAPLMFDLVDVDGRKGIIYERIYGKSMLAYILKNPFKIVYYARKMAQIHYGIHKQVTEKLPSQKERFRSAISDSKDILGDRFDEISKKLEDLDNASSVCHGDFHPDNILLGNKKYVIIDWMNGYSGNALGDVARTFIMLSSPINPAGMSPLIVKLSRVLKNIICKTYIKEYIRLSNCKFESIMSWVPIVAAARLREKIPGETQWLLSLIKK